MRKIDKLLSNAKHEALIASERKKNKDIEQAISRMTTVQLQELVNGEPTEERLQELFAAVGCQNALESG